MSQSIEQTPNPISKIHTSCKDCVFAIYEDKTQTDCSMGLIEKYKSHNTTIIEAYDEEKEFYILNNRKCIGFRKNSWFDKFGDSLTLDQKKDKVTEQFKIKYILFIDLKLFDMDKLTQLFNDINQLVVKPSKIILVRYNYTNKIFDYETIKDMLEKSNLNCPWRLQTMLDETVGIKSVLSNTISTNQQYKYICYLKDYTPAINKIVDKANRSIFEDLSAFVVISDVAYTAYMFLGLVYRYVWFTEQKDILEHTDSFMVV